MDSYGLIEPVRIALTNEEIIILTENFAKDYMKKYDDSHSFDHAMRVKNIATILASSVNLNEEQIFIIQLAALTHDINDSKYNNGENTQEDKLRIFFNNFGYVRLIEPDYFNMSCIICHHSFRYRCSLFECHLTYTSPSFLSHYTLDDP